MRGDRRVWRRAGGPFTTAELPVVLRLTSDEKKVELKEQIKVEPGTAESLRFDLPPLAAGMWQGEVAVELEDDLPLDNKRSLALREYALGLESLERAARGEPLWRIHECVFAVLALESEPIDPRL